MTFDRADCRSLRSGFLRRAAERPDAPAVIVQECTLSYGELEARARRIAGAMRDWLPRRPERVGVFAYRTDATYSGILGALCAGATYVPLNRTFPAERTRAMIRSAALDAIVVDRASALQLPAVLAGIDPPPLILAPGSDVDLSAIPGPRCDAAQLAEVAPATELPPVLPEDIAYLLFTSGTTGDPKGVTVTHGNVLHLLDALLPDLEYAASDRASQYFDHTFDVSVFDLFATWEAGGCVCVPQVRDLLAPGVFTNAQRLSVWFSVPSLVAQMRRAGQLRPGSLPTLRLGLFVGEAMPRATMEAFQRAAPHARVINMYGPTETTIVCGGYPWDQERSPAECVNDVVPIGRMFPGVGVLVVDDQQQPVPEGEVGELCLSGPLTCPGYWRDPAKTAERFVYLPVGAHEVRRFYRTGDRVVRMPTGDYAFLGRVDHQIKVRGYRIELGEIEAVMMRQRGVVAATALGWPLEDGQPTGIVAFATGTDVDPDSLMVALRNHVPSYMVPSEILVLSDFPLNVNGKTDRAALQRLLQSRAEHPPST